MRDDDTKPAPIDWKASVERIINSGACAPEIEAEPKPDHECTYGWKPKPADAILVKRGMDKAKAMRYVNKSYFIPCPICEARQFLRLNHAEAMTWETFDFSGEYGRTAEFMQTWKPHTVDQFLLIRGNETKPRSGKTHAMIACAHALILAGQSVKFFNAADLYFENRFEPDMNYLDFNGWLFIDDLGKENNNSAYREALDRALDKRWRSFVPTVITTKVHSDGLQQRYPRFMDRMQGGTEIEWAADTYRRAA